MKNYDFKSIEAKWQQYWEQNKSFCVKGNSSERKYYLLEMFPYPSGRIHMGHVRNYTIGDALARFKRMQGFNVLHPIGWDAFGLPAENAAIQNKTHPAEWTFNNIKTMRNQIKKLGLSYDWDREINTTDEKYYKWTQWIFLKLYERGLAYQSHEPVNWCPELGTVLANEEVIDGMPYEFRGRGGFDRVRFRNPKRNSRGPWQLHLRGKIKIKKIVVKLMRKDSWR